MYPYLFALDSIHQPARTAGLVLVLFIGGVLLAVLQPRYRLILALALATLGVIGIHAATVGVVPRYRMSVEPLINVVAMGTLVVTISWVARRVRGRPARSVRP
jgi:peptidoglycan/LPS O-acetylase OafA/YrhL